MEIISEWGLKSRRWKGHGDITSHSRTTAFQLMKNCQNAVLQSIPQVTFATDNKLLWKGMIHI